MKKIKSLFKRDYKGTRLVYNEVVPGAEWVIAGEGMAIIKYDGTCCMIKDNILFKRHDRKLSKAASKRKKRDPSFIPSVENYKPAPSGWEAAENEPDLNTGHWPGWVPVGDGPEDQYHREAFGDYKFAKWPDGTYELVGPKVQGNPYGLSFHIFLPSEVPRDFEGLKMFFRTAEIEGIVWHHPDGRMVKIKRRDFGFPWPVEK